MLLSLGCADAKNQNGTFNHESKTFLQSLLFADGDHHKYTSCYISCFSLTELEG